MSASTQLLQQLQILRNASDSPLVGSDVELIRQAVAGEIERRSTPQFTSFIPGEHRELFDGHQDQMQAFLESADGCDAWGLLVEAFRSFVEPPAQVEQPQDGSDEK